MGPEGRLSALVRGALKGLYPFLCEDMDSEKAYIMGLLHDIGRFEGVRGMHHTIAGYDLMMQKGYPGDATVTVCHSKTKDLREITQTADVLIVAIGKPKFINNSHLKSGAVVIDVGINRNDEGKLCGDCDYKNIVDLCEYVSPVPGGVGQTTVMALLENVISIMENK